MSTITIRPLTREDEVTWRPLWKAYLTFYETILPEDIYRSSFDRMLAGNSGASNEFRGMIAEVDGEPNGLVHYYFHRHGWKIEDVCYLQDLYVDPSVRGTGLGRALIEAVYEVADKEGCPAVYWQTQELNKTARQLYDRIAILSPFVKYDRPNHDV